MTKPKYSKLTKRQLDRLIEAFALGIPALTAATFAGVRRNTAAKFFRHMRLRIAAECMKDAAKLSGEVEADESYFGGVRKGKRGRAAAGKKIVFGISERGGRVRTVAVTGVTAQTLMTEIEQNTEKGCVYRADTFRSYNSLSRFGKHLKVNHSHEFTGHTHINGIEGFWSYAKRFPARHNGVSKDNFPLYLKEIERRFNNRRSEDLVSKLRKIV